MPVSGLDSFLNVVIPIGIFIFFGVIIGKAFAPQLKSFWEWFTGLFDPEQSKGIDPTIPNNIIYER